MTNLRFITTYWCYCFFHKRKVGESLEFWLLLTSMICIGKWRIRHMGSPIRSVTSDGFPLCPISQRLSIFSTATLCLSSSYSLTFTTSSNGFSSLSNGSLGQLSAAIFWDIVNESLQENRERRLICMYVCMYLCPLLLLGYTSSMSIYKM